MYNAHALMINSLCSLARLVTPPTVVRKIDWIETHWPDILPEDRCVTTNDVMCM